MRFPGRARHARGVSLVQVLVGACIGLSMSGALATFFIQGSRSSREDINVATMLAELGYATGQLIADVEMAGFWAHVHDPTAITKDASLGIGTDCGPSGWYHDLDALEVLDNPTAAQVHAAFPCIATDDVVAGADVIAVKRVLGRVAGTDTNASGLVAGTIYLRTHDKTGLLYRQGVGTPATVATPYENWEYSPAVYYVQKYTTSADEVPRVPSLCRMALAVSGSAPSFARACVAQGVENLQIEIGVDTDEDGSANYFTTTPTAAHLTSASTARLYLQVRSARADVDYTNVKTYQIGNAPAFTPAGDQVHYYRKTLTSEVALRNPRALQGVAVQ
jgi:type IV pilus assembly protein PilW